MDLDDFKGEFCGQGNYTLISHLRSLLASGKHKSLYYSTERSSLDLCSEQFIIISTDLPPLPTSKSTLIPVTPNTNQEQLHTTPRPAPTTTSSSQIPDNFCESKPDGLYAKPDDPHSFYQCGNGNTWVKNCPQSLVFQEGCKCCVWP